MTHQYMIYPRTKNVHYDGLETSKGRLSFEGSTVMRTTDDSLASEIDTQYGLKGGSGDVFIHRDDRLEKYERDDKRPDIHHYFFAGRMSLKDNPWRPSEDPDYYEFAPGKYRKFKPLEKAVRLGGIKNGKTDSSSS